MLETFGQLAGMDGSGGGDLLQVFGAAESGGQVFESVRNGGDVMQVLGVAESGGGDLLGTLGIDWGLLAIQSISFVLLVLFLAKFVYPPIVAMLDRHDKKIADAEKAAEEARVQADENKLASSAMLEQSRAEAAEIVEAAKRESAEIIVKAEEDANVRAEAIVANARDGLEREIESAREELRGEVIGLVAVATEKIVGAKIGKEDEKLIKAVIEEGATNEA